MFYRSFATELVFCDHFASHVAIVVSFVWKEASADPGALHRWT
jgi:hypothetical protein